MEKYSVFLSEIKKYNMPNILKRIKWRESKYLKDNIPIPVHVRINSHIEWYMEMFNCISANDIVCDLINHIKFIL